MIEDLEGATSEPSRRGHVAVLSAATAVFAIVVFFVLVAPPTLVGAPQASPSPSRTFVTTVASNSFINLPFDLTRSRMCADVARWGNPPFELAVDANGGRYVALTPVIYDRTGSRPIAFVQEERGTGRLVVTCVTPDSSAPRINRER